MNISSLSMQSLARPARKIGGESAPKCTVHARHARCTPRSVRRHSSVTVRAGIFDFLSAGKKASPDGERIAGQLLQASKKGAKSEIQSLAEQLKKYQPKSAASSPLLWGTWELVYASAPSAIGGALITALGLGKKQTTTFEKPDIIVNQVSFKTLGLLPGSVTQAGRFDAAGSIIRAQLREPNASAVGQAPINTKGDILADVQFDVVYLGEAAAVLRVVPADDEDDEEAASQPLFVLQKSGTQSLPILEEDDDDDDAEDAVEDVAAEAKGSKQRGKRSAARQPRQQEQAAPEDPEAARRQEIQAQVDRLEAAFREAQSESKEAAAELRSVEKESQSTDRELRPFGTALERAQKKESEANQKAEQASEAQRTAEERVRQAVASLREKEAAVSR